MNPCRVITWDVVFRYFKVSFKCSFYNSLWEKVLGDASAFQVPSVLHLWPFHWQGYPTALAAQSGSVTSQWVLLRRQQDLLDAFQTHTWLSFHCFFSASQLIDMEWTMCPSVCSSGRRSAGWECFQRPEVLQVVNITSSDVEVNPSATAEVWKYTHWPVPPKHSTSHPQPSQGALRFCVQLTKPSKQPGFIQPDKTCAAVPAEGSTCLQDAASLLAQQLLFRLWLLLCSTETALVCRGTWVHPHCGRTCWLVWLRKGPAVW